MNQFYLCYQTVDNELFVIIYYYHINVLDASDDSHFKFLAPTPWLTTICDSSFRGRYPLPASTATAHVAHRHTHASKHRHTCTVHATLRPPAAAFTVLLAFSRPCIFPLKYFKISPETLWISKHFGIFGCIYITGVSSHSFVILELAFCDLHAWVFEGVLIARMCSIVTNVPCKSEKNVRSVIVDWIWKSQLDLADGWYCRFNHVLMIFCLLNLSVTGRGYWTFQRR